MVAVHCPDCSRRDNAAELFKIAPRLLYQVVPIEEGAPEADFGVKCTGCGKRWAVKLLTAAA